jgi:hypothetical protein
MTAVSPPDGDAVADLVARLARAIAADATASAVAALAGGEISDDGALGLRARPDVPGVEAVTVTRRWESEVPNAAEVHLAPGLPLADVQARLGPGRLLRTRLAGDDRIVLEGGDDAVTTMASFDADGNVRSIAMRRDT